MRRRARSSLSAPLLSETMNGGRGRGRVVGEQTVVSQRPCQRHLSVPCRDRGVRRVLVSHCRGVRQSGGSGACRSPAAKRHGETRRGAPAFSVHTPRSLFRDRPVHAHTHPNTDAARRVHIQNIHTHAHARRLTPPCTHPDEANRRISLKEKKEFTF